MSFSVFITEGSLRLALFNAVLIRARSVCEGIGMLKLLLLANELIKFVRSLSLIDESFFNVSLFICISPLLSGYSIHRLCYREKNCQFSKKLLKTHLTKVKKGSIIGKPFGEERTEGRPRGET